ncbi:MAG TPA: hypothetical protein VK191_10715 [Symbiobacteriaceae bacterium]|nr:hypothetical protein [Symbiobacteriaceae bacterium]
MEALLVIGSPQKGRELILPLSLGGVRVRKVLSAGEQLVAELREAPVEAVLLAESLPDGTAEHWLTQIAALPGRPLVLLLLYGIEAAAVVQDRCRAAYGPLLAVLPAGALPPQHLASQAARLLEQMGERLAHVAEPGASEPSPDAESQAGAAKPPTQVEQKSGTTEPPGQPATPPQPPVPTTPPASQAATSAPISLVRRSGALSLAILGASGGVGTSTLITNLAALVSGAGGKVLVIDAGFTTGLAQAYLLGAQPDEAVRGLHHLRWGYVSGRPGTPADVAPWLDYGREIALLQLPPILDAIWNLPAEQILWATRAMETAVDLILFDLGTGIGSPRTLALMEAVSQIRLLVGGWAAGVQGASRLLAVLEGRPELERLSILLRTEEGSAWGARSVSRELGRPIDAAVPSEPLLVTAGRQERAPPPLVLQAPDSPYALAVRSLAAQIGMIAGSPQPQASKERRGLFSLALGRR